MIKFRCPHCDQKLGVPDEYANRRIRCNKCNEPSRVPSPAKPIPTDAISQQEVRSVNVPQAQKKMNAEEFFEQDRSSVFVYQCSDEAIFRDYLLRYGLP